MTFSDTDPWTFETWVNWGGQGTTSIVFYAGEEAGNEELGLRYNWNNRFTFRDKVETYHHFDEGSSDPYTGSWTLLTWVADGSGNFSVYANASLIDTLTSVPTQMTFELLGQGYTGNSYAYEGLIDEVRISDAALAPAVISAHYNDGDQYESSGTWTSGR